MKLRRFIGLLACRYSANVCLHWSFYLYLDHRYLHENKDNGCCIANSDKDGFHQRCSRIGDISICRAYCDTDTLCRGYVKRLHRIADEYLDGCEIATTSNCPVGFTQHNVGNVGNLDGAFTCGYSDRYYGCFIKQARKLNI